MGRICTVLDCPSGRNPDRQRRKRMGVRQVSLFKVPKCPLVRQKWSEVLHKELGLNDYVCEHHFNERDIKKDDKVIMPDGVIVSMARDHFLLDPHATPIDRCQDIVEAELPMEVEEGIISVHAIAGPSITRTSASSPSEQDLNSEINTNVNHLIHEPDPVPLDASERIDGFADHLLTDSDSGMSNEQNSQDVDGIELNADTNRSSTATPNASEQFGRFEDLVDDTDTQDSSGSDEVNHGHYDDPENCLDLERPERVALVANFTIGDLEQCLAETALPKGWTWMADPNDIGALTFVRLDVKTCKPILHMKVHADMSVTSYAPDGGQTTDMDTRIDNVHGVQALIKVLNERQVCVGTSIENQIRAVECPVILEPYQYLRNVRHQRCNHCRQLRRKLKNKMNRPKSDYRAKYIRAQHKLDLERRKNKRLQEKTERLKRSIQRTKQQCAAVEETALMRAIEELPEVQQEAVKACFSAAKVVNSKRRRYTLEWVYECILMRIKNGKLYEHLRTRNILPLPCKDTVNRYIQRMDTAYGFQTAIFDCLKLKSSRMDEVDKRGTLLIDEMALSESISLDTKTMNFKGFVDLGHFTPPDQQNVRADHALVFMFQPFRGKWVQVLGSFLSKNSVTSRILHKLILECLLLLGEAGFHVDVVTMDGAQWNRGVWSLFGIGDGKFSCKHPCDPTTRLWMISDFPHLIKCFRNGLMKLETFWTLYGIVMKNHWRALLDREGYMKSNLRIAYKLTPVHLDPKGYQKMNVPLAFELFSDRVVAAMKFFKDDPSCPQLKTADSTIKLCEIVDNLITAMMSRTPSKALRPEDGCVQKKAIQDFDRYLRDWERAAKAEKKGFPISPSTLSGLKVTLGSTLELMQFLHEEHSFDYLITARLNQDALERFFGMMRSACGCNDHPDPTLFAQVFRLLASYSLVKPPKGGNVCGTELLQTLMQTRESIAIAGYSKEQWLKRIDNIIENGCIENLHDDDCPSTVIANDHDYDSSQSISNDHMTTHDYDVVSTSDEVQAYIAGYVARKVVRFTRCEDCINSVKTSEPTNRDTVIDIMSHYGGLLYPSDQLFDLTKKLECIVLDIVGKLTVKINTLHQILDRVGNIDILPYVGCEEHYKELTKKVLNFYIITRGHFLGKSFNQNNNARKIKSKSNRKISKL